MAGVLQSVLSPSMASFAGESSLLDGHHKVFFTSVSRRCVNKGRIFCTSSNLDYQQSSYTNYQHNSPPPPHQNPPQYPFQQPAYQDSQASDQGSSRAFQTDAPQYPSNPSQYQAVQNQSPLYENPYRPLFKEPHRPMGYQQGPSQSYSSLQYANQPTQYQSQPQYQSPPRYQSQPPPYQSMQSRPPSQYQSPQYENQHQSVPATYNAIKAGTEPTSSIQTPPSSIQTPSSESSSSFQSTPSQAATETPTPTPQSSSLFSSTSPSSSSSSSSSFLSSSYSSDLYGRAGMSNVRRRPYDPEAKMRMKQYRREAMIRQRQQEQENLEKNYVLDVDALYKKGDPGTMQGVVKDVITVGYYMSLPDGREGFLPCMQFNDCPGGIPLLTRLFKVGDEITVRQEKMYDGGLDKLYAKP